MVYRQLGDRCTLSIHLRPDETASVALEVLQSALGPLRDAPAVPAVEPDPIPYEAVQQQPFEVWRDLIDRIHGAIASGDFDKLVAARRASVHADRPFDVVQILRRLAATYAGCTRFLVQVDDAAFVGATPERLFRLQGRQLVTHALAGSKFHGEPEGPPRDVAEAELLASTKDRWEHDVVVQRICTALGELDAHVTVPEEPSVISVRNLLHLNTPVEAVVPSSVHAPALIDALHPTPAVGGLPKWPAVDWIVAHEPGDRGWYTGTLGWIDADGAAEMAVAIRCGVVRGTTASLYAGAGVVADSTAEGEYEETRLKQHPMLHVLGVRLS
jgi:isochorismate synthase